MNACEECDVAVVGGGPVGLLLAHLLGRQGRTVRLLEAAGQRPARSMAIGITPPSLDLLDEIGLGAEMRSRGVAIRRVVVRENRKPLGALSFAAIPGAHPFVLSLPQAQTEEVLRASLPRLATVHYQTGCPVTALDQDAGGVRLEVSPPSAPAFQLRARFAVGSDGARSRVRELLGLRPAVHSYRPSFSMFDAIDHGGLDSDAHLFFGPERPVESFPLPAGRRRWIVRTGWRGVRDTAESPTEAVHRLTGFAFPPGTVLDQSDFQPRRLLTPAFWRGRVALCGDAAHVMCPIGGQGMNTGFADAGALALALGRALDTGVLLEFSRYDRARRTAFQRASSGCAAGMALGVLRGRAGSSFRGGLLRALLGHAAPHALVANWFSMRAAGPTQTTGYASDASLQPGVRP